MNTTADYGATRKAGAKGILRSAIFATLFMASLSATAQDVIITLTKMRQTLPSSLTELIDHPNRYLNVTLQNNTRRAQKVYLKLSMTTDYAPNGTPLEIHTQDRGQSRPCITLAPYQTRRMNQISDFEDHFGGGRLTTNATKDLLTLTRIPEGDYECCMEVYHWQENVVDDGTPLSSSCANYNVCYSGLAPELISPISVTGADAGNTVLNPTRTVTFQWTSAITNCPGTTRFNYTLKIVKVRQGMSPEYAIDHAPVIFSRLCRNTTYCQLDTLRNLEMPFELGAVYAVQVEAHDANTTSINGGVILGNDGKSQVATFSWGTPAYNVNHDLTGQNQQRGNRMQESESSEISNSEQYNTLSSFRRPYICYPYRDASTYSTVLASFPDELSKVPEEDHDVQIKYNGNYDDHIVNTKTTFDLRWMPVRGDRLTHVRYTVDLFDDIGSLADIDNRTPLAIKNIDNNYKFEGVMPDVDNPISLADTTWEKLMVPGKKYVARVVAKATYNYDESKIEKTVHYVNGIEADTEYDTVTTTMDGTESYTSIILFQWGLNASQMQQPTQNQSGTKPEEEK